MNKTIINFKNYKNTKEEEVLNSLDFINNVYVWVRCEYCGELLISKKEGYSDEIVCSNCKNILYTYMREATKEEILKYMIKHKIDCI